MFEKQKVDVEFDAGTFVAMVDRVVVTRIPDGEGLELRFELRNGLAQQINIQGRF